MTEKIKSVLQRTLETQGWEFLTNVSTMYGSKDDEELDLFRSYNRRMFPQSDSEIETRFLSRPFHAVKIADAYDVDGNPIKDGMRAVYVIRTPTNLNP